MRVRVASVFIKGRWCTNDIAFETVLLFNKAAIEAGIFHHRGQDFYPLKMARYEHLPIYRDALNLAEHFYTLNRLN